MNRALIHTDTVLELFRLPRPLRTLPITQYLEEHHVFAFSALTRFEIRREYILQSEWTELSRFNAFCQQSLILPATDEILDRAGKLWAQARQGGHSHGDSDLIIAATALVHGRTLVTGNARLFDWIDGLTLADWRKL